jgi:AraC-like DNA-binding protein
MAADLGVSERQLLRRFDVAVGYGPKMLGRVLRFQRFLRSAWSQTSVTRDLASLAYTSGYTDQSHLTHECLRLAGVTPGTLLAAPAST